MLHFYALSCIIMKSYYRGGRQMYHVAVIGATGYVGTEIIRLLLQHPGISVSAAVSQSFTGKPFSDVYPNYKNLFEMPLDGMDIDSLCKKADVFITALPHEASRD